MTRIAKSIIRIFSFPKKELIEILRQPRLILTLVLGPFLIILLFGLGYPDEGRALRTTFIVEDNNPFRDAVESFAGEIGPAIIFQGIENDLDSALANLERGGSDMVVVVPDNPAETIRNNEQAEFVIYHNEVDPFQIGYLRSVGRVYTDEVNRRVLTTLTDEGRTEVEDNLSSLNEELADIRSPDSYVLVRPFVSRFSSLSEVNFTPVGFLTPAVLVLLVQHLSVTFAALSIVRESKSGIMELFRVAPLSALETLLGKYMSYMFFNALITALLTLIVVLVLKVPMLGAWTDFVIVMLVLPFASLGVGFLISLISDSEIHAVQYSMLFMLTSIFFSGFFLDLRLLQDNLKILAWSLPATYGIRIMQDVMLRGNQMPMTILLGLAAIGVALFVLSLLLLRRKMLTHQ
ncbi:MAG TPA: ABC transporter permease [Anaerolineales bacterium]|nr:ABC transporter permease [Anaerolineales bacterium]